MSSQAIGMIETKGYVAAMAAAAFDDILKRSRAEEDTCREAKKEGSRIAGKPTS